MTLIQSIDISKMHDYQRDALKFSLDNPISYQALDMGLGKTFIALKWAEALLQLKDTKGTLIIAPLRPVYTTWPDEVAKWTPTLSWAILHGPDKLNQLHSNSDLYFINYEGIPWLFEAMSKYWKITKRMPFRAIVMDEASMFKSHRTKRFKNMIKIITAFPKWRMMLSATPAPKSLLDIWSQYRILDGGKRLGTSFTKFRDMFFYQVDHQGFYWNAKDGAQAAILDAIKDITYRLPSDGHIKMPELINNQITVTMPPKLMAQYKQLETDFFYDLDQNKKLEVFNRASLSMKLRQFIQGAVYTDKQGAYEKVHTIKIQALKELLEVSAGQPILCAIQFRFELDMIREAFPNTPYIAKGISATLAQKHIHDWNNGDIPLLLCHPASLSHGVNLQNGGHIILWFGMTWSPEQYIQLRGRLARQGQLNETVVIHHLVMKNTVDEAILRAQRVRGANQASILQYLNEYRISRGI